MPCDKLDCCGDDAYGYEIVRAGAQPLPVDTFTLELSADPVSSGTVTGAGTWAQNSFVTITATPVTGYVFTGWTGDFEGTEASTQIYMNSNKVIVANFALQTFYLSLSDNPPGTSVLTGAGPYSYGDTANISCAPIINWQFDNWSGDITSINNPESVLMDGNKSIVANLSRPLYALTVAATEGGTAIGGGEYPAGSIVNITAFENTGYEFVEWTGSDTSSSNPLAVTMDGDKSFIANFIPKQYNIAVASYVIGKDGSIESGEGGIVVVGTGTYNYGTVVILSSSTIVPDWTFNSWQGDTTSITNPTEVLVDGDKNILLYYNS